MSYEAVIGLEIHVQLKTKSKMFCGCGTRFGEPANSQVCPVCLGLPGALPVINLAAFELAMRAALALNCEIADFTKFDRKNYYYPDLPKNYQISQYDLPFSRKGRVEFARDGAVKRVGITRAHLEEDAGKLLHDESGRGGESSVDLNRAGTPLLEVVSDPDLRSPAEAKGYMERLSEILQYTGVSDCNMQEGNFRCDANVSVRPSGETALGVKVEIKNLNSFRFVEQALAFEIKRQVETLTSGGTLVQETRLFDSDQGTTRSMRTKEFAHDYRYFPDPDLPPIRISREWVERVRATVGELPEQRRERYRKQLGLSEYDAEVLAQRKARGDFFEAVLSAEDVPAKAAANWIVNEAQALLKELGKESIEMSAASPRNLAKLIRLVESGTVGRGPAKDQVLPEILARDANPEELVRQLNLTQVSDASLIVGACDQVIAASPKQVAEYRGGKQATFNWIFGQVMRSLKGKADPKVVRETLERRLKAP